MEEYVGGAEYFVNGQVDAAGAVTTIAIFEYRRSSANGHHNIDHETMLVPHRDPLRVGAQHQQILGRLVGRFALLV